MLSAPTSQNKTKQQGKTQSEPETEGFRRSGGWVGYDSLNLGRGLLSTPSQQTQKAAMQRTYGNQAVLRMQRSPRANPLQGGVLQRKCACGNSAGSSGSCAECQSKQEGILQTKLQIGEPGDRYEQEADRVADLVMRMPEPTAKHQVGSEKEGVLHRKAIANSITPLQSSSTGQDQVSEVPPIVDEVLRSSGQSLDTETRAFMEPRFGQDFSQVRVHTDAKAAESTKAVNALAYTVGKNIVFSDGQYLPRTRRGNHLLAHELTHIIQQDSGHFTSLHKLAEFDEEDDLENDAEETADGIKKKKQKNYDSDLNKLFKPHDLAKGDYTLKKDPPISFSNFIMVNKDFRLKKGKTLKIETTNNESYEVDINRNYYDGSNPEMQSEKIVPGARMDTPKGHLSLPNAQKGTSVLSISFSSPIKKEIIIREGKIFQA